MIGRKAKTKASEESSADSKSPRCQHGLPAVSAWTAHAAAVPAHARRRESADAQAPWLCSRHQPDATDAHLHHQEMKRMN